MRGPGPKSDISCLSRYILYILTDHTSIANSCKIIETWSDSPIRDITFKTVTLLDSPQSLIFESEKGRGDKLWHMWRWVCGTRTAPQIDACS
jgi:hypothetical protein